MTMMTRMMSRVLSMVVPFSLTFRTLLSTPDPPVMRDPPSSGASLVVVPGARCEHSGRRREAVMSEIAVTGATGQLGRRLAERLAVRGLPQRLVVRNPSRGPGARWGENCRGVGL